MSSEIKQYKPNLSFSQRYGYEPLPEPMKLEQLSANLRRVLCDVIHADLECFVTKTGFLKEFDSEGLRLVQRVFGSYFEETEYYIANITGESQYYEWVMNNVQSVMIKEKFYKTLNFIEYFVANVEDSQATGEIVASLFKEHGACYRLNLHTEHYWFYPISCQEHGESIENSLQTLHEHKRFAASKHLRDACEHINQKQYSDAISDSIHAVESVARQINPESKTLAEALKSLENSEIYIHRTLKNACLKLYGYTCQENGIRHPLIDSETANVGEEEALFMFGACASFAAFLTQKNDQVQNSHS